MKKIINKIKNRGFTLVEALILLGFVSVALALTIPVVNKTSTKTSLKELWKQDFAAIVRAYSSSKEQVTFFEDNETQGNEELNDEKKIQKSVEEFSGELDIAKYCINSNFVCGITPQVPLGEGNDNIYKTLTNGHLDKDDLQQIQFMLKNGANVYSRASAGGVMNIWVDVNGYIKGPNRLGRDLFGVVATNGRVLPMGLYGTSLAPNGGSSCDSSDKIIPVGSSGKASDYAGASCSLTILLEDLK